MPATVDIVAALSRRRLLAGGLVPVKVPAASVGDYVDPNPEKVAATNPDLILCTIDTERPMYDKLTGIAPTVVISFEGLSLKDVTTKIGTALGRSPHARDLLRTYDTKAAGIRQRHAAALADLRFAFASPTGSGAWWLYGPEWTDLTVLRVAGAQLMPAAASLKEQTQEYSFERLDLLADADVLLVTSGPDGKIAPENAELTKTAMWKRLPAVRAGRVFPIPYGTSSPGTAFTLLDAFDRLLGTLA